MKNRWIVAGAAALAVALFAVPLLLGRGGAVGERSSDIADGGSKGCPVKAEGKAPLNFTLKDMNGTNVRLTDFKGKVILMNFWATWCGPCKTEIPAFNELYAQYKDQGFVVLGVSTDDEPEALRAYAASMKMNYPVLVGRDSEEILDAWGPVYAIPTSFFVGRDGSICGKHMGPATKEDFEREIKALL
ncbi:MAG TPA: TlpA disulfide reductase family protein [Vicinamibacterales bacterium]|nr:TlpA disulfide reductase family protein [Vicinamibacterales bacterium]